MSAGDLSLAHPEWVRTVVWSWALAAALLMLARGRARGRRRLLGPSLQGGISLTRDASLLLALAAIGLALLGPRIGERGVMVASSGIDVVLLLDSSRSMDAADLPPSRFARARRAAQGVVARLRPGDRAGLAAFADRGVLLAPLTPDRGALDELVAALDTQLIRPAGSNLGAGVRSALTAFEAGSARPRVIVVLSDGEDPRRRGDLGAPEARRAEARVLTVAFGSEAGATLPDHGVPLRDTDGNAVVTRRRADRLQRLAAATGGAAFEADAWGEVDLKGLEAALHRDSGAVPGELVERRVRAVRVLPFAALAALLLVAEGLRWRPPRRAAVAMLGAAALLLGAGPGQLPAERVELAPAGTPAAATLVELGLDRLARGRRGAARRALLAAALTAREPELAGLAYYDLGVLELEAGNYEAARDAFFDALSMNPADREARYNLEWALKALPSEHPPPPAPEEPDPGELAPERERPEPEPEARPGSEAAEDAQASELTEAERRRWLARVNDDLRRALASAAGNGRREERSRGPAW